MPFQKKTVSHQLREPWGAFTWNLAPRCPSLTVPMRVKLVDSKRSGDGAGPQQSPDCLWPRVPPQGGTTKQVPTPPSDCSGCGQVRGRAAVHSDSSHHPHGSHLIAQGHRHGVYGSPHLTGWPVARRTSLLTSPFLDEPPCRPGESKALPKAQLLTWTTRSHPAHAHGLKCCGGWEANVYLFNTPKIVLHLHVRERWQHHQNATNGN